MPHSTPMLNAVVLASALGILGLLVQHFGLNNAFAPIEAYRNEYQANRTALIADGFNQTHGIEANATVIAEKTTTKSKSFWLSEFPKESLCGIVYMAVRYLWLIWLERLLPARPRPRQTPPPRADGVVEKEEDDSREEEVIRKWIEAGKVQRASLSWFNTLAKWVLDLSLGNLWQALLWTAVLDPMQRWEWPFITFEKFDLIGHFFAHYVSAWPVAALIGFILIPAQKRIVFEEGVGLVADVFVGAFLHVLIPWLMTKEFMLEVFRNMTDSELPEIPHGEEL